MSEALIRKTIEWINFASQVAYLDDRDREEAKDLIERLTALAAQTSDVSEGEIILFRSDEDLAPLFGMTLDEFTEKVNSGGKVSPILLTKQADPKDNGVYSVREIGGVGKHFVLERIKD